MTKKQTIDPSIKEYIIQTVKNEKPGTVNQLTKIIQQKYPLREQEITRILIQLENEGKLHFSEEENPTLTPKKYIFSSKATWYWSIITLAMVTTITVFTIPEEAYPIVYIRYVLGSIFVLWLPGYSFIKALFPTKELDSVERISLSIGMSLALVPIVGLLLNFTPWGIRTTPVILSLLALTTTFATAAVIREHQNNNSSVKARCI